MNILMIIDTIFTYIHDKDGLYSRIVEFIEYHRMIGINHMILYFRSDQYREELTSIYPPHVLSYIYWPGVAFNRSVLMERFYVCPPSSRPYFTLFILIIKGIL